jgi:hypothetical protein
MIFPEKIDFFGISSPAKTPSNVWTNWCVWVSKRLSTEVSSGVQQFVSMELLYPERKCQKNRFSLEKS